MADLPLLCTMLMIPVMPVVAQVTTDLVDSSDSLLVGVLATGEAHGLLAKGADQGLEVLVPGRCAPVRHVAAVGKTESPCSPKLTAQLTVQLTVQLTGQGQQGTEQPSSRIREGAATRAGVGRPTLTSSSSPPRETMSQAWRPQQGVEA